MNPVMHLLVLGVVAAVAAAAPQAAPVRPPIRFICARDECTCEDQEGFELVTCDCRNGGGAEPLLLGERSAAYLSDRTQSLRVHHCSSVSLVAEALSNAISLTDVEFSDIAELELEADSLYTDNGPQRRVTVQRVADLRVDPQAFQQVTRLEKLQVEQVVVDALPLDSFAVGADVVSLQITNSKAGDVSLGLGKADTVTVANCTLDALSADVGDVLSVQVTDNTIKRVDALRFNVRSSAHSTDTNKVTIARNTISAMDSEDVQMSLDTFALVNNTLGSLMAPLSVEFNTAQITGNEIGRLGPSVFDEFVRLEALDLRVFGSTPSPAELAFTFGGNTIRAAANGSYGRFLTPVDNADWQTALFRVYGNRFSCRCEEMADLVRVGEEAFLAAEADPAGRDGDDLALLDEVYGELYRTSKCVEGDQPLRQYRLTAYTAEFECEAGAKMNSPNGAAAAAAGVMTLLLAAVTAGLAV